MLEKSQTPTFRVRFVKCLILWNLKSWIIPYTFEKNSVFSLRLLAQPDSKRNYCFIHSASRQLRSESMSPFSFWLHRLKLVSCRIQHDNTSVLLTVLSESVCWIFLLDSFLNPCRNIPLTERVARSVPRPVHLPIRQTKSLCYKSIPLGHPPNQLSMSRQ
jgi:hypothetical protein